MGGLFKKEQAIGQLGHYELLELLEKTGKHEVYRARRQGGRDNLHLKLLTFGEPERDRRLLRSIQLQLQLNHPALLPLQDWGTDNERHFLVTEPPGKPLIIPGGGGEPAWVLSVVGPLAHALHYLHGLGLVHRDLRPEVIYLGPDGPRIVDFSLMRPYEKRAVTRIGTRVGTPAYMAPEQALAATALPASDQYTLGVVTYELLTGNLPFEGEDKEIMVAHAHQQVDVTGLPASEVLGKMLGKDPEDRYDDVLQAWNALKEALRG